MVDVVVGSGCGLGGQGHSSKIGGLRGPLTHSWTQMISRCLGGRVSHRADLQIRAIGELPALVCIAENILLLAHTLSMVIKRNLVNQ